MAQITPNMQLVVWNLVTDTYNYEQLADNFLKIDQHDHSKIGKQIDASLGIKDGTIVKSKLAADSVNSNAIETAAVGTSEISDLSVTTTKLADQSVTTAKLATNAVTTDQILDGSVTKAKLSAGFVPSLVETLPSAGSLTDGYEIYYLVDKDNSVVWHLRYQAGDNGAIGRWQFLGGRSVIGTQPANNYSGSTLVLPPAGRQIDGSWRSFTSIVLPKGRFTITISGHGNISWTQSTASNAAIIANAQFQMGFAATASTTLLGSPKTSTFGLIPYAQRTWFEAPITKTSTDLGMPVSHTAIYDNTSSSVAASTPIQLFARRTTTATEDAASNTSGGYMSKGVITATPIYLMAS